MELKREAKINTINFFLLIIYLLILKGKSQAGPSWTLLLVMCCCTRKKMLKSCNKGNPTQKKEPNRKAHCDKNQLDMVLIQKAEHQIIRASQRRHFSDEIKAMERNECEKKSRSVYQLDSYNGNEFLRDGGRLNQSTMDENVKQVLLISKGSILARLTIK